VPVDWKLHLGGGGVWGIPFIFSLEMDFKEPKHVAVDYLK
jgi:hypothetical protein